MDLLFKNYIIFTFKLDNPKIHDRLIPIHMLAEFSVAPVGMEKGMSQYVAQSLKLIRESGLNHELHAMGTIVEGEPEEVFALIKACHLNMRSQVGRVVTTIKIDDKVGVTGALSGKVASVKEKLD